MAQIVTITKNDTPDSIKERLKSWNITTSSCKLFDAKVFTGKIKSFGDGIIYQRKLRDEWR